VSVQTNAVGQEVFAFDLSGNGTYFNQSDLSFNGGSTYKFDVSDPANNGYTMVFGTEVDVSSTIMTDTDKVIRSGTPGSSGANVVLLLQDYSGNALYYFEDTSAGMGYTGSSTFIVNSIVDFGAESYGGKRTNYINGLSNHNPVTEFNTFCDSIGYSYLYYIWNYVENAPTCYIPGVYPVGSSLDPTIYNYPTAICLVTGGPDEAYIKKTFTQKTAVKVHYGWAFSNYSAAEVLVNNTIVDTADQFYKEVIVQLNSGEELKIREVGGGLNLYAIETGVVPTTYIVSVAGGVYDLSGTQQFTVPFTAGEVYVFDQSDPTNAGEQLVFGETFDDKNNLYTTGVTIIGTAGQKGAYTQIVVPNPAPSSLSYYSLNSNGMGA
jgi:hypothetical protein